MSGTSADGIDAALVEIRGNGVDTKVNLLEFETYPYPDQVSESLNAVFAPSDCSTEDICEINFLLGRLFAHAALDVIKKAGLEADDVDLIGSHGQTVCHLPDAVVPSTLQLGEPGVIANLTGIVTVGDFRVADMAVGGQGAPLVPYVDYILLRDDNVTRAIQNIGGISNVTLLPAGGGIDDIIGFDTGPGNMVIDGVMGVITEGKDLFDKDGQRAGKGKVNQSLLGEMLKHPFICSHPPKTTGREEFGFDFTRQIIFKTVSLGISDDDLVATVTAFTVESIYINYKEFIMPEHEVSEILVCGGGLKNVTLMKMLQDRFGSIPVVSIEKIGISSDAKEAMAFAVLANETIFGNPGNVPGVTGAKRPVVLGKICL
ncbi:anhydro-N-acetylmuramic acid kinase [Candidatus Poribacteria bacterium]|nr:anhydro-N-acetylmuramic acid kinase [Candidatus Poribacteria bacterium]